jgi:hypothetical protein
MNRHLSAEQISDWVIGQRTPEQEDHLRECPECAAEVEKIEAPIALFRGAVRHWSSQQEVRVIPAPRRSGLLWLRWAATAAVLVVLIAIGIDGKNRRTAREDDALLEQVQAQVSRSVPAPMQPLYELMSEDGK